MSVVQKYLVQKRAEELKKEKEKRDKVLIDVGLFQKVYRTADQKESDFAYYDYDKEEYYNEVPFDVTDEEYEEILKYQDVDFEDGKKNGIATTIKTIGVLTMILGFILGIVFGVEEIEMYGRPDKTEFLFEIAAIYWSVSFVSGFMFLGFGEIIKLLQDIKNNQKKDRKL